MQRFGTKRGLLVAFAERAADRAAEPFVVARERTRSPLAALRAALAHEAHDVVRDSVANSISFLVEDLRDPDLLRAASRHASRVEREIQALLEQALAAGELVDAEPARLARVVSAVHNGALLQWALRGDGPASAWARRVLDDVLAQYRPRRASRGSVR